MKAHIARLGLVSVLALSVLGGCSTDSGVVPTRQEQLDGAMAHVVDELMGLATATGTFRGTNGRWPKDLAELSTFARRARIDLKSDRFESVDFNARPDGGLDLTYEVQVDPVEGLSSRTTRGVLHIDRPVIHVQSQDGKSTI